MSHNTYPECEPQHCTESLHPFAPCSSDMNGQSLTILVGGVMARAVPCAASGDSSTLDYASTTSAKRN